MEGQLSSLPGAELLGKLSENYKVVFKLGSRVASIRLGLKEGKSFDSE